MSTFEILQNRNQLECACKNKVFTIVVSPNLATGGAEVIEIYCVVCQKGVGVSDGKLVISKPDPTRDSDVYTDRQGKRHHSLKCDPIIIGITTPDIGNN